MTLHGFAALELLAAAGRPGHAPPTATASRSAKAPGSRCCERAGDGARRGAVGCSAPAPAAMATTCRSPHPEGAGAVRRCGRRSTPPVWRRAIDYVNLHGTGTPRNDAMEDRAVHALFGDRVPCSSTKG